MIRVGLWLRQGPFAGAACSHAPKRQTRGLKNMRANRVRVKAAPLLWGLSNYRRRWQLGFHFGCDVSRLEIWVEGVRMFSLVASASRYAVSS
jgi:hypothetical protein